MTKMLLACHPNFLMNVSHAYIVAANPDAKGTAFASMSDRSITHWAQLERWCANEDDVVFYHEANAIMLSYARAISGAYRIWRSEIEMAHRQFDVDEKQMTNLRVLAFRVGLRVIHSLFKLLMALVFGYVLTLYLDKAFVPSHVVAETGVRLPATLGALGMGMVATMFSTYRNNKLWHSAAAELSWCLGSAEEELERASIEAFDIHWSQFSKAYRAFSGRDYGAEPFFIGIMRGKLLARERWNQRRLARAVNHIKIVIEAAKKLIARRGPSGLARQIREDA